MTRWELANWIIYLSLVLMPFLMIYGQRVSWNTQIETSFMSGMMTASGIFFALITSFTVTQRKAPLPGSLVITLFFDGALLFSAGVAVFNSAINRTSQLSTLALITASFNVNGWTALGMLLLRVFEKPQPS